MNRVYYVGRKISSASGEVCLATVESDRGIFRVLKEVQKGKGAAAGATTASAALAAVIEQEKKGKQEHGNDEYISTIYFHMTLIGLPRGLILKCPD